MDEPTTPDPLAELRALAAAMHGEAATYLVCDNPRVASTFTDYADDLVRILDRLGEARVMYGNLGSLQVAPTKPDQRPHLVIPIKETDRAD